MFKHVGEIKIFLLIWSKKMMVAICVHLCFFENFWSCFEVEVGFGALVNKHGRSVWSSHIFGVSLRIPTDNRRIC